MKKVIINVALALILIGITLGVKYHNISLELVPKFNLYYIIFISIILIANIFLPLSLIFIMALFMVIPFMFTIYFMNFGIKGVLFSLIHLLFSKSIIIFLTILSFNYLIKMYKYLFLTFKNKSNAIKSKKYLYKNAIINSFILVSFIVNNVLNTLYLDKLSGYLLF